MIKNNIEQHIIAFNSYADCYIQKFAEPCLVLKKEHTHKVLENARIIASSLQLSEIDYYIAELIALYHDLGRFYQYSKYKTFVDKISVNHAVMSVKELKKIPLFLTEEKEIQKSVLCGIILHNIAVLPKIKERYLLQCNIIRDADKLDIIRVMAQNFTQTLPEKDSVMLHVKDEPESFTPFILEQAINKELIRYTDLTYINDFKLLLLGWFYNLNFSYSKKMLIQTGYFKDIIATLPKNSRIEYFIQQLQKDITLL